MDEGVGLVRVAKRHKPLVGVSPQICVTLGRSSVLVTVSVSAKDSRIASPRNLYRSSCSDDICVLSRLLHEDSTNLYVLLGRVPILKTLAKRKMTNRAQAIMAASICERVWKRMLSQSWIPRVPSCKA